MSSMIFATSQSPRKSDSGNKEEIDATSITEKKKYIVIPPSDGESNTPSSNVGEDFSDIRWITLLEMVPDLFSNPDYAHVMGPQYKEYTPLMKVF